MGQRAELPGVELHALRFQLRADQVGQREVDVVAAEQDVIAHRHAGEGEAAVVLAHLNEGEIAGAAAHVHHQDDVGGPDLGAPLFPGGIDPGVERGLRFFQQRQLAQARVRRRRHRQLARHRIKGRGHRQRYRLVRELHALVRVRRLPGVAQLSQDPGGRLPRRDARDLCLGARRQQLLAAKRQPALRRRHQPRRHLRAPVAGEGADHEVAQLLVRGRQVDERRQELARRRLAGRDQLRHLERHRRGQRFAGARRLDGEVHLGQGAVGGAEIDSD